MKLASLQAITWGTVTAAVSSALLLASFGSELLPADSRNGHAAPMRSGRVLRVPLRAATATTAAMANPTVVRTAEATPPP